MSKGMRLTVAAVVMALGLAACGGGSEEPSAATATTGEGSTPAEESAGMAGADVVIKAFDFQPPELTVGVGEKVIWENEDDILHTVTSGKGQEQGVPGVTENTDAQPDGMFDGDLDGVGSTFEFTFTETGTFPYYCAIHPGMTGTITVE